MMKFHVFGRCFKDIFIYGDDVHSSEIVETAGGSGLNASAGLSLLGVDCLLHSSYGNDYNGRLIRETLNKYTVNSRYLKELSGPSNLFVSRNGAALAAQVGESCDLEDFDIGPQESCLIFATEMNEAQIDFVLKKPWRRVFIDLGPKYASQPFPDHLRNGIVIGNESEAAANRCDVVKRGKQGACWGDTVVKGNTQELVWTIGAGDLFDVVFVFGYLQGFAHERILKDCVNYAERACHIPGSSSKVEVLREYNHFV